MLQEYRKDRERLAELHVNKGLDLAEIDTSAAVLLFLTHVLEPSAAVVWPESVRVRSNDIIARWLHSQASHLTFSFLETRD